MEFLNRALKIAQTDTQPLTLYRSYTTLCISTHNFCKLMNKLQLQTRISYGTFAGNTGTLTTSPLWWQELTTPIHIP